MRPAMLISLVTAAIASSVAVARADAMPDAFRKNGCTACHSADHKMIGPSYDQIAAKYRGDADALAKLMKKVKDGGGGVWGTAKMTPHPNISDDDLQAMVTWILAQGS